MRIISKIAKLIEVIFFVFIFLLIALACALFHGISLESVKIFNLSAQKLYVKLDNKLILEADEISWDDSHNLTNIEQTQKSNEDFSIDRLKKLKDIKHIFTLFSKITITKFHIYNKDFAAHFDGDFLAISGDVFTLNIQTLSKSHMPVFLQYGSLIFDGNLNLSSPNTIDGKVEFLNSSALLNISGNNKFMDINLSQIDMQNLQELAPYFHNIPPAAYTWIFQKTNARQITGTAKISLHNGKLKTLDSSLLAKQVGVKFHPQLQPALAQSVNINLKNFNLLITSKNASYKNVSTNNLELKIPLFRKFSMDLNIDSSSIFNADLAQICAAYGINIPLSMKTGKANSNFKLHLEHKQTPKLTLNSQLNGVLNFAGSDFDAGVNLQFDSNKNPLLNIKADINNQFASMNKITATLNKDKIFNLTSPNLKITNDYFHYLAPFELNYNAISHTFNTNLLGIKGSINNENLILESDYTFKEILAPLETFKPEIHALKITKKAQKINIDFDAKFNIGSQIEDHFNIQFDKELNIKSRHINLEQKSLKLSDLTIDAQKIMEQIKQLKNDVQNKENTNLPFNKIILNNCTLIYKKSKLNFDYATVVIKPHGFILQKPNKTLFIDLDENYLKANIYHLKASDFNDLVGMQVFTSGELAAQITGKNLEDFNALINIIDAKLAHTKSYINLIKVLDSFGSILRFKSSAKASGLGVKIGSIELRRQKNALLIDSIQILGNHFDASGAGSLDLSSEYLSLNVNLFTLKNTSKVLQSLPLINRILMGSKNSTIATTLQVRGKIDDLHYSTSVAKDIITTPFRLIENVVKLPQNLLAN